MYESYPWPGAYSIKSDFKFFINYIKSLVDNINKKLRIIHKI